jgi:hypothetical protein
VLGEELQPPQTTTTPTPQTTTEHVAAPRPSLEEAAAVAGAGGGISNLSNPPEAEAVDDVSDGRPGRGLQAFNSARLRTTRREEAQRRGYPLHMMGEEEREAARRESNAGGGGCAS